MPLVTNKSLLPSLSKSANRGAQLQSVAYTPADRKSTRLNSSHSQISYAVFCLKKKSWSSQDLGQNVSKLQPQCASGNFHCSHHWSPCVFHCFGRPALACTQFYPPPWLVLCSAA